MSGFSFSNQEAGGRKDSATSQPQDFLSLETQSEYAENNGVGLNQLMLSAGSFVRSSPNPNPANFSAVEEGAYIPIRHSHPRGSWVFMKGYGQRILTPQGKKLMCLFPNCGRLYVDANGSTNGLKSHLRKVHNVTNEDAPSNFSEIRMVPFPLKPNHFRPSDFIPPKPAAASQISSLQSTLKEALVEFLASNGLPPQLAVDEHLQKILRLAHPSDELPNLQQELGLSFSDTKGRIKWLLLEQSSIALSIAPWESHLAISAHFITEEWEPKHVPLSLVPFQAQSSTQLAQATLGVLDDFGIASLVFSLTTDGGAPVALMVQELGTLAAGRRDFDFVPAQHHISCLAHIMSCAINDALRAADKGSAWARLEKLRNGIASIRTSPAKLATYQRFFFHRHRAYRELVLDKPADWASTYAMIERIQEVYEAYNEACFQSGQGQLGTPLTQEDLDFFGELKDFLGPFQSFVSRVATSGYPTISKTCLLYDKMLMYLSASSPQKPDFVQQASYVAQQAFASQFSRSHTSSIFPLAAALDPRVKFAYWKPPLYTKAETDRLVAMVQGYWDQHSGLNPTPGGHFGRSTFDTIFELEPVERPTDLHRYLGEPLLTAGFSDSKGVLQYWRSNAPSFPTLSKFARRFLAVPVSSRPWEEVLSRTKPALAPGATVESALLQRWKQFLA